MNRAQKITLAAAALQLWAWVIWIVRDGVGPPTDASFRAVVAQTALVSALAFVALRERRTGARPGPFARNAARLARATARSPFPALIALPFLSLVVLGALSHFDAEWVGMPGGSNANPVTDGMFVLINAVGVYVLTALLAFGLVWFCFWSILALLRGVRALRRRPGKP